MATHRWVREAAALSTGTCRLGLLVAALIVAALAVAASISVVLSSPPERIYLP